MPGPRPLLVAIVMVSLTGGASAEERPRAENGHVPPPPDPAARPAVSAGVGVDSFLGTTVRSIVGPGPSWNVRASMGSLPDIRIELVYAGSSQALSGSGMDGGRLVAHGVHGLLRPNVFPNSVLEPFFYIGAGWSRFHVTGSAAGELRSPDHVLEVLFGFGAARRFGRFVLDARAGLSLLTGADLVPPEDRAMPGGASMHRIGGRVSFGMDL